MPVLPAHPTTTTTTTPPPRGCRPLPALGLREDGYDIRTVRELMGHASVETTMIYTHVLNKGGKASSARRLMLCQSAMERVAQHPNTVHSSCPMSKPQERERAGISVARRHR